MPCFFYFVSKILLMIENESRKEENVIADYADGVKQAQMEGLEKAIKKARNALFWAGGLFFAGEMNGMYRTGLGFDPVLFGITLVEAAIFIALGFWTRKKPYTAVVTGLIVFIGLIALSAVSYGMLEGSAGVLKALVSGIVVKIVIIVNLVLPLKDARELQEAKKEN